MTSKLKCPVCPYCDKPLHCDGTQYINKHIVAMWYCQNPECEYSEDLIGTREMWEVFINTRHIFAQGQENTKELAIKLIQAKQDLEIARKALKDARIFASTHCIASAVKTIDKALETIGKHNE